ncbi:hypothetical protein ACFQ3N_17015 [Virgibacillus byunsanensis]|uniref:Uncharacterized protein n=2 Tax=Virgibacillus byunsanensis TaxID=570945 RepID=A0ABW3LRR7_9BACI
MGCLILYHTTITSLTKCNILQAVYSDEEFEIEIMDNNTVVIYLWNIKKAAIWQAVLLFEVANIMVGYGFGDRKKDTMQKANKVLLTRMELEDKTKTV